MIRTDFRSACVNVFGSSIDSLTAGLRAGKVLGICGLIAVLAFAGCAAKTSGTVIITDPTNVTVTAGATATFTAAASGEPAPTVQWEVSTNGGGTFTAIAGATSATLSFATTAGESGNQYEAVFTNSVSSATTTAATLTVNTLPMVTTNPTNVTVTAGGMATFTAAATGSPSPTVQWQVSTNGGVTFTNITGATSTTLSFTTTAVMNGNEYQAVFTNAAGSATTTEVTLVVNFGPTVTTNPVNVTVTSGAMATFTAAANGNPAPTVQWMVSTNGGASFTAIGGATSTTLSFTTSAALSGNEYEAVFTNSVNSATTTAATLTVNTIPVVSTNPTSDQVTAGGTATFTAAATGSPSPTVQWQASTNGGTSFSNIPGATSTTLSFSATASQDQTQYQAVFTNAAGSVTTTAATLTVQFGPTITQNPSNVTQQVGNTATFSAAANGDPTPTVQWMVSTDGGATFNPVTGATSATLSFTVLTGQSGNEYEAVFTNIINSATTTAATLTIGTSSPCAGMPTGNESMLNGQYAILLHGWQGSGSGSPVAVAASVAADGAGNVASLTGGTGGDLDMSTTTGSQQYTITPSGTGIASTYTVGPDSTGAGFLGCMTVATVIQGTVNAGPTITFTFSLGAVHSGVASQGQIIEFDDSTGTGTRISGVMMQQDTTAFSAGNTSALHANYAFGSDGQNSTGHVALGGSFVLNPATGNFTSVNLDVNVAGTVGSNISGSGSIPFSSISAVDGRGTLSISYTLNSIPLTNNSVIYIVNANEFFTIGTDAFGSGFPVRTGRAIVSSGSYTSANVANMIIRLTGQTSCTVASVTAPCATVALGLILPTASTSTTGTFTGDVYNYDLQGGETTNNFPSGSPGTFTVTGATGRVTLGNAGSNPPVFYLASPAANTEPITAFFVSTNAGSGSDAQFGIAEAGASSAITTASLAANYFFGTDDPGDNTVQDQIGVVTVASSGALTGTQNSSGQSGLQLLQAVTSQPITITNLDPGSNSAPGTGTIGPNSVAITNGTRFFFILTGTGQQAVIMVVTHQ